MDDSVRPLPVPKPRTFPIVGVAPGPRCGQTLTAISGPDGDLSKSRLLLFGGATALEGSGKEASSPGPSASAAGIRLAGATNDVHTFDIRSGRWEKITPLGEPPSPRAAHAAAAVGNMVVIQGGIGPAGLATEDLHVLDFTDPERPRWHRVMVQGAGPSARYAHTLSLVANRFLVAMGGNDGKSTLGDAWALDTSEKPYQWRKITDAGEMPSPRMYATAAARGDGLLLLCGGRDAGGTPMGDAYGFARHRDGRWEWHAAPGLMPTGRYQHGAIFVGNRLHISGGAVGGGRMVDEATATVVLDTNAGQWVSPVALPTPNPEDPSRRCRHAVASVGPFVFIYGGLKGSLLLDDLLIADDSNGTDLGLFDPRSPPWMQWMDATHGNVAAAQMLAKAAMEEAAAALSVRRVGAMDDLSSIDEQIDSIERANRQQAGNSPGSGSDSPPGSLGGAFTVTGRGGSPDLTLHRGALSPTTPDVRLWHRAVVVHQENHLRGMVRQLSIDQLDNEGRRVGVFQDQKGDRSPLFARPASTPGADRGTHKRILNELLRPRTWKAPDDRHFFLTAQDIGELCDSCERIFRDEKTVLELHAPIKIFGDLHGQFGDLMRLFEEYGTPSTAGDITYIDYLFLGDYVDRGSHSLETICLLLALKMENPRQVHLIRGNHEAHDINALFGFRLECLERLGDEQGLWVWRRINDLFNHLPLAANIEGKILCMHGGIGRNINRIEQIQSLVRPITMEEGGPLLMDLLWSDPTTNDAVQGVQPSPRGPGLVTFGPDRVKEFCKANGLQMIVRAHECVMDGFERFASGHLITLFSATNYCGTAGNAGAILVLGRDLVMVPKLIHPLPPSMRSPDANGNYEEDGHSDTWMQQINEERPPTPPRGRPHLPGNSLEYF